MAGNFCNWGWTPTQIAEEYGLTEIQVNEALGFYTAHRTEIDGAIATEQGAHLVVRGADSFRDERVG